MKIIKTDKKFEIEMKRCYLPFVLKESCPICGKQTERDLGNEYLSYPETGENEVDFYCYNEETGEKHEFIKKISISIEIKEIKS